MLDDDTYALHVSFLQKGSMKRKNREVGMTAGSVCMQFKDTQRTFCTDMQTRQVLYAFVPGGIT